MLSPRRHHDPAHAARTAELYGGSMRDDPALARNLLHATARPGPARGMDRRYLVQSLLFLGVLSPDRRAHEAAERGLPSSG